MSNPELKDCIDFHAQEYQPELYEALKAEGLIKEVAANTNAKVKTIEEMPFEEVERIFLDLLKGLEEQIQTLQERIDEVREMNERGDECLDHDLPHFEYPVDEFFKPFKEEILASLERKEIPDIGLIGYGSLNSSASTSDTVIDPYIRELVTTKGLQRGLFLRHYSTHDTRKDNFWSKPGSTKYDETGEMAVRYKEGQLMNGVRLSGLSLRDLENLADREFPYFLLPCGAAKNDKGEDRKLNLVCWPIGNELTRTLKSDKWEKFMGLKMFDREDNEIGETDKEAFQTAHAVYLHDLKPDIHYTETCLDIGNTEHENIFLDTTFVPMPEGDPITLREYLANYAPANDPEKREYFGPRIKKESYVWNDKAQKWELKKEVLIKATERLT